MNRVDRFIASYPDPKDDQPPAGGSSYPARQRRNTGRYVARSYNVGATTIGRLQAAA